jgi:hypothetical protein
MAEPLSLIGKRFGKLTVTKRAENTKKGNTQWECMCDCGNKKIALGYDLTHKRTVSCGCEKGNPGKPSKKRKDLSGMRFGKLTVIELDKEKTNNGILIWKCRCDCGKETVVRGGNLKSGRTISCGCTKKEKHAHNFKDLTGKKYGRLTVICECEKINNKTAWLCECECGNSKKVIGNYLVTGTTKSCGCLLEETIQLNHDRKRENYKNTNKGCNKRIYCIWLGMIYRCSKRYHAPQNYFYKGITVCEEWHDFDVFCNWAINNGYNDSLTIDRIDNDGNYCPNNCRWVTMKVQQNNRSNNVFIEYLGERKTMKQWCETLGLNYGIVRARRRRGINIPELFDPPHKNQYK